MKEMILDRRGQFPKITNIKENMDGFTFLTIFPTFEKNIFHSRQECLKCFHLTKNRFKEQLEARFNDKLC